mgnify:CR=1 FL=1
MNGRWSHWVESAGGVSGLRRWALGLAAVAVLWFDPSSGLSTAILSVAGLYALWNGKKTLAAWKNPVGALFGAGVLWAVLSASWSFYPPGSVRDLVKSTPLALGVLAIPAIFDRPGRIWAALLASAGVVTATLTADLVRLYGALGWPTMLTEARYFHPYLYTHPNVSSMMAGLCALTFVARFTAGAPGWGRKALLAVGLALDVAYLVALASRGPQAVFALAALAFPVVLLPGWRSRLAAAALAAFVGWGLWHDAAQINPRFHDGTMGTFNNRDTAWGHSKLLADRRPVLGYGFGKKAFVKAVYENPDQRAPLVPVRYPHAHSYWLMLYFQGGAVGLALWGLGWLALFGRLLRFAARAGQQVSGGWLERLRVRVLPSLLAVGLLYILIYGIGDFPDSVIRASLFYLIGLALALGRLPERDGTA